MGSNKFYQKEDYWVMTIKTKGTVHEEYFNGEELEILFDGDEETINKIKNSNWCLSKSKANNSYYISTGKYNNKDQNIQLHKAVFGKVKKGNIVNHISRFDDNWKDNRLRNLEEISKKENSKNKTGAGYPRKRGNKWSCNITIDGYAIATPGRDNYEEADLDILLVHQYYGYKHRQDEWVRTEFISEEYRNQLTKLMEEKLKKAKQTQGGFRRNSFEEIDFNGNKKLKVYGAKNNFFILDIEDKWILDLGRIRFSNDYWYFSIKGTNYKLHRFLLGIKDTNITEIQVDHLDNNANNNTKDNLIITTTKGNLANKKGKGYSVTQNKFYCVKYDCYWEYIRNHSDISDYQYATFRSEEEARKEVYKRKYLVKYIRPKFKNYEEYLIFKQSIKNKSVEESWINSKFPDINSIKIPKFDIDKL